MLPDRTQRAVDLACEKDASNWLTVIPLKDMDFDLNKREFHDAVRLRLFTVPYFFVRSFGYTMFYRHGMYRGGGGDGAYSSRRGGGEKNRGTVISSLQFAFTGRVVPATQAFDWSLDNRCYFMLTTGLVSIAHTDKSTFP